ncbi:hypothetical protein BsIDN1_35960 [Bacillus safensis]|uniref:Uncharacterized protein n=1 Tax=Bacillus safensis TaxID=561879 RepID=A0A5S9MAP7_BACIA|nr:hypothetical protein BsIDN1_35960 [Bacillus safensis]
MVILRHCLVLFLYFDVSFMIWVLLGALGAFIAQDFALSTVEKGMIVAIPILSGFFFGLCSVYSPIE